jgi:hypothetical protein
VGPPGVNYIALDNSQERAMDVFGIVNAFLTGNVRSAEANQSERKIVVSHNRSGSDGVALNFDLLSCTPLQKLA